MNLQIVLLLVGSALAAPPHTEAPPPRPKLPAPTIELPRLLTAAFHKPADVCADAKKAGKKLAIIAIKSHICDCEPSVQFCMHVARVLSDPCNKYLRRNFAMYHTRSNRYDDFEKGECAAIPGTEVVSKAWEEAGKPVGGGTGIFIYDVDKCVPIHKIGAGQAAKSEDIVKRREATRKLFVDELKKVKEPNEAVRAAIADTAGDCSDEDSKKQVSPSLRQIWDALEAQSRETK